MACRGALATNIKDLLSGGPIRWLLISNFMVDMKWFVSAAPSILDAERVTVVHGERSNPTRYILQNKSASDWQWACPLDTCISILLEGKAS